MRNRWKIYLKKFTKKNTWNQVEQSVKIKETDGMEIGRGGGRCDLVGKKGEPAAIKEEKKGGLVQASASADGAAGRKEQSATSAPA